MRDPPSPQPECFEDRSKSHRRAGGGPPTRYSKGRFLGKGGFAKCYEVRRADTSEIFAAKIVAKTTIAKPRARAKLRSEIAIHRTLDHEHVVKFHDHFEDADNVFIILEMCPNQTLNEYVRRRPCRRLTEPEALFFMYDLIMAVQYLHRNRVIHRDLKLGNLLIDAAMHLKIGDFGLAAQLEYDGEKKHTICGTPNYIAPEILENKYGHSYEVDIWSVGVILYTILVGRPPFETSDIKTTYRRIKHNQYSFPDGAPVSAPARDLITRILRLDPRSRPSLQEILNSSWFQASRLPPPMPANVAARSASPRNGATARSETPERGTIDYAHIDSPANPFPLRERSPGAISARSNSPFGPNSPQIPAVARKAPSSAQGPRAASPGLPNPSRPPLACRTNDENAAPPSNNVDNGQASIQKDGKEPSRTRSHDVLVSVAPPSRTTTPSTTASQPLRVQAATCGNGFPRVGSELQSRPSTSYVTPAMQPTTPRPMSAFSTGRDLSPVGIPVNHGSHRPAPPPPSVPPPPGSTRSATQVAGASPRVQACPATPTAGAIERCNSARSPFIGGSDVGPFAQTTPATVQSEGVTRSLSARGPVLDKEPGSPDFGARNALTPCAADKDTDRPSRTPLQPLGRRQEHCASSPALILDVLNGCGAQKTPTHSASHQPLAVAGNKLGSARSMGLSARSTAASSEASAPATHGEISSATLPELWVTRWVDYSSKYGVGYILSDGSIGVYFNDSTKIILGPSGTRFDYITRRTQEKPETRTTHAFEEYPEELRKKVTLLRHFKNYMLTDSLEKKDGATMGESGLPLVRPSTSPLPRDATPGPQQLYVKKWMRNKHAILFQLCNKIVQVVFFDGTELVLSSKAHMVTYIDKKRQRSTYPLSSALDVPCPELGKRLRYTKDILVNLLCGRPAAKTGGPLDKEL